MGVEEVVQVDDVQAPLLTKIPQPSNDPESRIIRTGTLTTATAHIITAVIGSGVLSLAWCMAQLGWIAGPLAMLFFASVTMVQSGLLADCYRFPDSENGPIRNHSYTDAVKVNLGEKSRWLSGIFLMVAYCGSGVAYIIVAANSISAIQRTNCYHKGGHHATCNLEGSSYNYMLLFGIVQIFASQIPNFHEMAWLSTLATIMSFSYASIGFILGLLKVIVNGTIQGSIGGVAGVTTAQKILTISQAMGDIAFAYPFSIMLLEIEDTLKSPPSENKTMKKASRISVFITTIFYLCCGSFGYAAFGDDTPGNLLTDPGFYEPYWLIDLANACVVLHLVGGYQIITQPVFGLADRSLLKNFPENKLANRSCTLKIPCLPKFEVNIFRICFRTLYVMSTTSVAILFPYFNQVLGIVGAFNFWPLSIYFPVEMYLAQRKITPWTKKWVLLQSFSLGCLLISLFAFIGSVHGVFTEAMSKKSIN